MNELENNKKLFKEEIIDVLCKVFDCKKEDIIGDINLEDLKKEAHKKIISQKHRKDISERMTDDSFGSRLMQIRIKTLLSQSEAADKSNEISNGKGFTSSAISGWEHNKMFPAKKNLKLLMRVFNCTSLDLIGTNDIDDFYAKMYEKRVWEEYKNTPQLQDKIDDNPIGERFFKTRIKRGLSMQHVEKRARKLNEGRIFTATRLSALEHRTEIPTKEDIEILLKVYDCNLYELTGRRTMREALASVRKKTNLKNRNERRAFNDDSFGYNLRRIRQEINMTQADVIFRAKEENIHISNTMTLLENNKEVPTEEDIKGFTKIFNCEISDLIGTDDIKGFCKDLYNKKMKKVKEINNIGLNIKLQRRKNRLTQINTIKKAKEFTNGVEILTLVRLGYLERNVYKTTDDELKILSGIFNCNISDIDNTKE